MSLRCGAVLFCAMVMFGLVLQTTARNKVTNRTLSMKRSSRQETYVAPRFLWDQLGDFMNIFSGFWGGGEGGSDDDDDDFRKCDLGSCECGVPHHEMRIVGGRPTQRNRYPWIARLVYDGKFHCGGSLLSRDYVLTAAHCVRKVKRSKMRVILGDHDKTTTTDGPAKMRAVSLIIRHRNFEPDSYNHDIALLRLKKPVDFSKNIAPVCLTLGGDPAGKMGTVMGWGRTKEGGMLPSVVQEVQVPILSLAQCRAMKYGPSRITNNMICAGKGAQDSCQGDSGGPLMVNRDDKYEVVGIVSWGVGCGRPGYPGVYTRLFKYISWLKTNLDDTCMCS